MACHSKALGQNRQEGGTSVDEDLYAAGKIYHTRKSFSMYEAHAAAQ